MSQVITNANTTPTRSLSIWRLLQVLVWIVGLVIFLALIFYPWAIAFLEYSDTGCACIIGGCHGCLAKYLSFIHHQFITSSFRAITKKKIIGYHPIKTAIGSDHLIICHCSFATFTL